MSHEWRRLTRHLCSLPSSHPPPLSPYVCPFNHLLFSFLSHYPGFISPNPIFSHPPSLGPWLVLQHLHSSQGI